MITRAYRASYLGGTPSQETGASPPSCLLLDICLYIFQKYFPAFFNVSLLAALVAAAAAAAAAGMEVDQSFIFGHSAAYLWRQP